MAMDRRPSSKALRAQVFEAHKRVDETGRIYLECWICAGRIYPSRGDRWDAEHAVRRSVGGSDETDNVLPAHDRCHDIKTPRDIAENAKGKRVSERHFGIKRARGFRKPKDAVYDWERGRYVRGSSS